MSSDSAHIYLTERGVDVVALWRPAHFVSDNIIQKEQHGIVGAVLHLASDGDM